MGKCIVTPWQKGLYWGSEPCSIDHWVCRQCRALHTSRWNYEVVANQQVQEESHQYSFRKISAGEATMTNLSPAAAVARSSIHQLTTSMDTMDLVCHGPSTVNPDAFNSWVGCIEAQLTASKLHSGQCISLSFCKKCTHIL